MHKLYDKHESPEVYVPGGERKGLLDDKLGKKIFVVPCIHGVEDKGFLPYSATVCGKNR